MESSILIVASKSHLYGGSELIESSRLFKLALRQLNKPETKIVQCIYENNIVRALQTTFKYPFRILYSIAISIYDRKNGKKLIQKIVFDHEFKKWNSIIQREKPDLILGIGLRKPLIKAARIASISTIEIQHGIIDDETIKLYWNSSFTESYRPDIYLGWDEFFRNSIEKFGIKFILLSEFQENYKAKENDIKYRNLYCLGYKNILIWKIFSIEKELLRKIKVYSNLNDLVRLHPLTDNKPNRLLLEIFLNLHGINLPISKSKEFIYVLKECQTLISAQSATYWEAWFADKNIETVGKLNRSWFKEDILSQID